MMMHKWRSLFVIGCLMAALVAFAPDAAFAQAAAMPSSVEVNDRGHDELRIEWESTNANTAKFSLRYQEWMGTADPAGALADFDLTRAIKQMDVKLNSDGDSDYRVDVGDLKPDTTYVVGITAVASSGTASDNAAEQYGSGSTDPADTPDDVMGLELMAGDGMIMAMWDETTDNGSPITGYQVDYKMSDEADSKYKTSRDGEMENTSTEWTISNLENDEDYTVRVRACSFNACGDWSDEEEATPMEGAMPTPALPLFGAFALGAGLLAAGRARLRRREQHQLTTR